MYASVSLTTLLVALVATSPSASAQEQITPTEFKNGIDIGAYDLVLDVRPQDAWDAGHITTSVNIPNDTFEDNDFWKTTAESYSCNGSCATIVVYCKSGGAAATAIVKLKNMGFEGTILNGQGVGQWTDAGFELTQEDDAVEPVCATKDICALESTADAVESADSAATSLATNAGLAALVVAGSIAMVV